MKIYENIIYLKNCNENENYLSGIIYNFTNLNQLSNECKSYYNQFMTTNQQAIFTKTIQIKSQIIIDPIKVFKLIEKEIKDIKISNYEIYFTHLVPFIIRCDKFEEFKKILDKIN